MSRRKQSNPKPLKWDGAEKDGEAGEGEIKQAGDVGERSIDFLSPFRDENQELNDGAAHYRTAPDTTEGLRESISGNTETQSCEESKTKGLADAQLPSDLRGPSKPKRSGSKCSSSSTPSSQQEDSFSCKLFEGKQDAETSQSYEGATRQGQLPPRLSFMHLLPQGDASRLFLLPPMVDVNSSSSIASLLSSADKNFSKSISPSVESNRGTRFLCEPCNIQFSSAKTLEAHQTYYCSYRKGAKEGDNTNDVKSDGETTPSSHNFKKRERVCSGDNLSSSNCEDTALYEASQGIVKLHKTGKLYSCIYCSYSADKKVSLNRHMRMHSGTVQGNLISMQESAMSPPGVATSVPSHDIDDTRGSDGLSASERYCQDCDIQFLNIKTFRVHKQFYCSTRHILKAQQTATSSRVSTPSDSPPSKLHTELLNGGGNHLQTQSHRKMPHLSPITSDGDVGAGATPPLGSQPYVILPTNPVIVVPYSFIQGASMLPSNLLPPQNALVVLPNGAVQYIPTGHSSNLMSAPVSSSSPGGSAPCLNRNSPAHSERNYSTNSTGAVSTSLTVSDRKDIPVSGALSQGVPQFISRHSSRESLTDFEVKSVVNSTHTEPGHTFSTKSILKSAFGETSQPAIDLSVKTPTISRDIHDEEKENRTNSLRLASSNNWNQLQDSDIVESQLPRSISVSLSSTCSTPTGFAEPKVKDELTHMQGSNDESSRNSSAGGGSKSPTEFHPSCGQIPKVKSPNVMPGKPSQMTAKLPGGAILTRASGSSLSQLLLSENSITDETTRSPLSASRAATLNPALLSALSPDLALRLLDPSYLANVQYSLQQHHQLHQPQPRVVPQGMVPQTGRPVKRGISKCIECDIVFYKHENFLVHKEHYCAATRSTGVGGQSKLKSELEKNETLVNSSSSQSQQDPGDEKCSVICPKKGHVKLGPSLEPKCVKDEMKSSITATTVSSARSGTLSPQSCLSNKDDSILRGSAKISKSQYPCRSCGMQYDSPDTLQVHKAFYCRQNVENSDRKNFLQASEEVETLENGTIDLRQRTFRCFKCALPISEDQMLSHSQSCAGLKAVTNQGWNCPCCKIYSPTMSAAQKHLETHSGIRAFKCLLCGYRGNTLRGMRTHIRMHFDKRTSHLQESDYIFCITAAAEDESESVSSSTSSIVPKVARASQSPPDVDSENSQAAGDLVETKRSAAPTGNIEEDASNDLELEDYSGNDCESSTRFSCCICKYVSKFKANMIRHLRLIHMISDDEAHQFMDSAQIEDEDVEVSRESAACHSSSTATPSSPAQEISDMSVTRSQKSDLSSLALRSGRLSRPKQSNKEPEQESQPEKTCSSSRSSEEENDSHNAENPCEPKYCKSRNIYFHPSSSYLAHKQLYCSTHVAPSEAETLDRAGTPVQ